VYCPLALQLPAETHDTDVTTANPPLFRLAVPGTSSAVFHFPLTWLTTNACERYGRMVLL
jgi:hypothetical protein